MEIQCNFRIIFSYANSLVGLTYQTNIHIKKISLTIIHCFQFCFIIISHLVSVFFCFFASLLKKIPRKICLYLYMYIIYHRFLLLVLF